MAPMKVPVWSLRADRCRRAGGQRRPDPAATSWRPFGLLAAGIALVGLFVLVDWRMHAAVLPPSVFGPGPLKWIYLTMGVLMGAAMVDTYVPLFGQRLAHLTPVAAGFLGAALALGWTVSEILSASLESPRTIGRVIVAAPIGGGVRSGPGRGHPDAATRPPGLSRCGRWRCWWPGSGSGWPGRICRRARWTASTTRPKAVPRPAAINTVQLISAAFGAGLAGVVVNTAKGGDGMAARWLFAVFTALCVAGVAVSYGATRGVRELQPVG